MPHSRIPQPGERYVGDYNQVEYEVLDFNVTAGVVRVQVAANRSIPFSEEISYFQAAWSELRGGGDEPLKKKKSPERKLSGFAQFQRKIAA